MREDTEAAVAAIRAKRNATAPPAEAELRAYVRGELDDDKARAVRRGILRSSTGVTALAEIETDEALRAPDSGMPMLFDVRGIGALEARAESEARLAAASDAVPGGRTMRVTLGQHSASVAISSGNELLVRISHEGAAVAGARVTLRLVASSGESRRVASALSNSEGVASLGRVEFMDPPGPGARYVVTVLQS